MEVFERTADLRGYLAPVRAQGRRIGFVPTMGFLHAGHLALMRAARSDGADCVVASIFVNPLQFGPREDYRDYPRDLDKDKELCMQAGVDALFVPPVEEMYPRGFATHVEVTGITDVLCGRSRPGHFKGVATVVVKLFNIARPDCAYFGLKDAQQVAVIQRMTEDLNLPVEVKVHPTVREKDGLAVSSRNIYLSPQERQAAAVVYRTLERTAEAVKKGERHAERLKKLLEDGIRSEQLSRLDYAEVVSWPDLRLLAQIGPGRTLLAVAAYFGTARLIDNIIVDVGVE